MRFHTPRPTVTLSVSEIEEIVAQHLQDELQAGQRLGNLVSSDLSTMSTVDRSRTRLAGALTFEIFSESDA